MTYMVLSFYSHNNLLRQVRLRKFDWPKITQQALIVGWGFKPEIFSSLVRHSDHHTTLPLEQEDRDKKNVPLLCESNRWLSTLNWWQFCAGKNVEQKSIEEHDSHLTHVILHVPNQIFPI